jgi:hypothetical protein
MKSLDYLCSAFHPYGLLSSALPTLRSIKRVEEDSLIPLKHERRVFLLSVRSAAFPHVAPVIGLEKTVSIIKEIYDANEALVLVNENGAINLKDDDAEVEVADDDDADEGTDPTNAIYISDMQIDDKKKIATILIVRGDPEITNPGYTNPATKEVRVDQPETGESPGYSAHLVISYAAAHTSEGKGRAVLERMPTVSRSIVFAFLNRLLKKYAASHGEFEYEAPGKKDAKGKTASKKEKKPYRPRLAVTGKKSSTLQEDIKKGYVSSVDLIDRKASFGGLDANDKIRELTRRLEYKLDSSIDEKGVMAVIKKLTKKGKDEHFDEVQIHVRGLAGDASVSPRFTLDVAEAQDFLYIRNERITGFSKELEPIYAKVEPEIVQKMNQMLNSKNIWDA